MQADTEKYGLVLAGGGGKGAYEIGVWKAISECENISVGAVSGTSVGALNGALFAAGDYDVAESIWKNIAPDKILYTTETAREDIARIIMSSKRMCRYFGIRGLGVAGGMGVLTGLKHFINNRGGFFAREGLINLIGQSGLLDRVDSRSIPCYATCYDILSKSSRHFCLNTESRDMITKILLASSAIPIIFPPEMIGLRAYCDGGIRENVPIEPLYDIGFRKFIVVHLNRNDLKESKDVYDRYSDARMIHVLPEKDIEGSLNFNSDHAKKLIENGYNDMKKIIIKC